MIFHSLKLMMNMLFLDTSITRFLLMDLNLIFESTLWLLVTIRFEFMFLKKVLLDLQQKSIRKDVKTTNSCTWRIILLINDQVNSKQIRTFTRMMKVQNGLWQDGLNTWILKVMTWTKFGQTSMMWFSNHLLRVRNIL